MSGLRCLALVLAALAAGCGAPPPTGACAFTETEGSASRRICVERIEEGDCKSLLISQSPQWFANATCSSSGFSKACTDVPLEGIYGVAPADTCFSEAPACKPANTACAASTECCANHVCLKLTTTSAACAFRCTANSQCASNCCAPLQGGGAACAPASFCTG